MGSQRGTQRVIIAGAGPIGAVLAYALRQRDIPVVLIEALATPEIDCREVRRTYEAAGARGRRRGSACSALDRA